MSRSQKVNEPETMSTSFGLSVQRTGRVCATGAPVSGGTSRSPRNQAELARRYHISYFAERGVQTGVRLANQYLRRCQYYSMRNSCFHNGFEHFGDRTAGWVRQPQPFAAMFKREKALPRGNAVACQHRPAAGRKNDCLMWNYSAAKRTAAVG